MGDPCGNPTMRTRLWGERNAYIRMCIWVRANLERRTGMIRTGWEGSGRVSRAHKPVVAPSDSGMRSMRGGAASSDG
jgi:hypothetical protein